MWTVERDESNRVVVPYYGAVKWHDHEASTYARRFLIDHQPVGVNWRLTVRPPFFTENDRRPCSGCRPGMPYSACEYALWAKAWQKAHPPTVEADAYRWMAS